MPEAKSITYYDRDRREGVGIRTFLLSDHQLFIDAVIDLTRSRTDFSIVGFVTGLGLVQHRFKKIQSLSVDVILIDATMKEADAIQITRKLKDNLPDAKLVIFGLEDDENAILNFAEAGAVGYLLKQSSVADIASTIAAVHQGQSPCSSRIAASLFTKMAQLARHRRESSSPRPLSLTARELEILRLVSTGLSNKAISEHLSLALPTVKNHMHSILEKLQARSRREAIGMAQHQGIFAKTLPTSLGLVKVLILLIGHWLSLGSSSLSDHFNYLI